ncbi:hypothetical protein CP981_22585 [Streptomyces platensis]|uniref:Uncharacterized protein n=1 Tax=Streptomyces platensis TaxID=58346 RepID=A0AAE6NJT9_STRPT|nr:hypothetical protein CP981_22585 [Streptomyces platensis]
MKTSVRGVEPRHLHHTGGLRHDQARRLLTTLVINTPRGGHDGRPRAAATADAYSRATRRSCQRRR